MSEQRLNLEMVEQAKEKQEKTYKRVEVKVGSKTAIVKVAQLIDSKDKVLILQRAVDLAQQGLPEEVAIMLSTIEVGTNIDFPEELIGKLSLLEYLEETSQLEKIFKSLPEKELGKIFEFIHKTSEGMKKLSEAGQLEEDSKLIKMLSKEQEEKEKSEKKE